MRITIHTNSAACDIDTLGAEPKVSPICLAGNIFGREIRLTGAGRRRCCFPLSEI